MNKTFKIGDVGVELNSSGVRVTGRTKEVCEKVADYLFDEGFVTRDQPILIILTSNKAVVR
jgi:hypothetical protein